MIANAPTTLWTTDELTITDRKRKRATSSKGYALDGGSRRAPWVTGISVRGSRRIAFIGGIECSKRVHGYPRSTMVDVMSGRESPRAAATDDGLYRYTAHDYF